MDTRTLLFDWPDKLLIGVMTVLLFVAGFFASLLALAVGCAMALTVGVKLWWIKRQHSKAIIDAEYQVLRE